VSGATELQRWYARASNGHKGTFGSVLVVGGSCAGAERMIGAPVLAARAALRSGCGLVRMMVPQPIAVHAVMMLPSATGIAIPVDGRGEVIAHECAELLDESIARSHALVIGPGFGDHASIEPIVLRALQQSGVPVVVDADALNAMARIPELSRDHKASCVLTPHPGEFRRLAQSLNIDADPVEPSKRVAAAEMLAQRVGCIVVLKGAGTVVTNGHDTWTCTAGHACMATGGTGDVLSGVLGGLIAQMQAMGRMMGQAMGQAGGMGRARGKRAGSGAEVSRGPSNAPPTFADAPGLASVLSRGELMALAAAKLGRQAPSISGPSDATTPASPLASALAPALAPAPAPAPAPALTLLDVVKIGVQAHALAGEAWARHHKASAGMLAAELADFVPSVLEGMRSGDRA